jgi:amino acid transporter
MSSRTVSGDVTLKRALGLRGLTLFGLAYLVPLTVFTTYGIVTELTGGRLATAYAVTLVAMIFTALSYSHMVRAYPVSGSAYTYTRRTFGGHAGFLAGWSLLLDYLFLPMINYLVIGIFLNTQFPSIPISVWALISIALVTVLNLVGVTSIAQANALIIAVQAVFIAVFVALALKTAGGADIDLAAPFAGDGSVTGWSTILAGAAILCLSFLGFDAVSTMAEEAERPTIDIPKAILYVTVGGGLLFIVLSYLSQLAFPPTTFEDVDSAAVDVMTKVGGDAMASFFVAAYVAGAFGSALTSQASVSRILYAMGRDGVLPRLFGSLWAKFQTPAFAVSVVSVLSLGALIIDLGTLASLISFGALIAFTVVNLAVIKHFWVDKKERAGSAMLTYLVLPAIGVALTAWLWTSLSDQALTIGLIWLAAGFGYLVLLTRGFSRRPPQMDLKE